MMSTNIDSTDEPIGAIVREFPQTADLFESFGIDYCCNGQRSLQAAAQEVEVDPEELVVRIEQMADEDADMEDSWESMDELIAHIETVHHDYLRNELPALSQLVAKVRTVHSDEHPELPDVHREFNALVDEMLTHIREEEEEVFPLIVRLEREGRLSDDGISRLRSELRELEDDHERAARALDRIDVLTDGFVVPDDACPSYETMLSRLAELKRDTHRHVHKENNVLFQDVAGMLGQ